MFGVNYSFPVDDNYFSLSHCRNQNATERGVVASLKMLPAGGVNRIAGGGDEETDYIGHTTGTHSRGQSAISRC